MKKSNTSERLKQIMKEHNLKQVDILEKAKPYCERYNIELGKSALSQYVSGKVEPGDEKLTILGLALDVNEVWLMGYDVPQKREATLLDTNTIPLKEQLFLSDFRSLNPTGQDKAVEYVSDLADNPKYKKVEEIEQVKEEEEPYVPKVMAAHHPTYHYSEEDFQDIDNILKIVAQKKREKGEL